jgi:hypothetical protein
METHGFVFVETLPTHQGFFLVMKKEMRSSQLPNNGQQILMFAFDVVG